MDSPGQVQLVTFRVGVDTFAADVFSVERVIEYARPKTVPGAPEWIEGVIEYQSRVVPTINLRKRFELAPASPPIARRIVVFNVEGSWVAAIVDSVQEVKRVNPEEIALPPEIFRGLPCEYLKGILREGEGLTIYLDVSRLFSSTERLMLREISEGAERA
jgi:purine-binding chemotaxis protein CheW